MLSSYGTACLVRLSARAFSSDVGLQAKSVVWGSNVPIYAGGFPEPLSLMDMAWCLLYVVKGFLDNLDEHELAGEPI